MRAKNPVERSAHVISWNVEIHSEMKDVKGKRRTLFRFAMKIQARVIAGYYTFNQVRDSKNLEDSGRMKFKRIGDTPDLGV